MSVVDAVPPLESANELAPRLAVRPAEGVATRLTVSEKSPRAARLTLEVPVVEGATDVELGLTARLKSLALENGADTSEAIDAADPAAARVTHVLGKLVPEQLPVELVWNPIVAGPPCPTMS